MKKLLLILISILILLFLILFNYSKIVKLTPPFIKENIPDFAINIHKIIKPYANTINFYRQNAGSLNGLLYNVKLLPNTQFGEIFLTKKKLYNQEIEIKNDINRFFIDKFKNNIVFATFSGNLFYLPKSEILQKNSLALSKIPTNLKFSEENPFNKILDLLIYENKILISYSKNIEENNNCNRVHLAEADINFVKIKFKEIYRTNKCYPRQTIQGGRIQPLNFNGEFGYLLTVAANKRDNPNYIAQLDDDHFGKVIFINPQNKDNFIFSKGHRNPQGLLVTDYKNKDKSNVILSTEHGPQGGDEINSLSYGENYGWPISSYGISYFTEDLNYKKSHIDNGFTDPLYTFIPSIGISEIREIPFDFWQNYKIKNLFFVTSLNGNSIFQIKLDENFSRIIFTEKIFIGQRIRDILVLKDEKIILLSLERSNSLGILSLN